MNQLFFELIHVALGTRICLSHTPSADEWGELYLMAKKQSLVGVCFAGVQRLQSQQQEPPEMLYLTWMGMAAKIQQKNETINRQCVEVQKIFLDGGLETCILKGQGVGSYYNVDLKLLRQSGDIDIWVNGDWRKVMDYVNALTPNREFDDKHTHLNVLDDTIVEVHWWPSTSSDPIVAKRLKVFYSEQATIQCAHKVTLSGGATIYAPDTDFEAIHVAMHAYGHYLYEGVGLRQLMDLYFTLMNVKDKDYVYGKLCEFGAKRFMPYVMHIMKVVFDMGDRYLLCPPDALGGKELLDEIMYAGNFGQYDEENRVANESFVQRMYRRLKRKVRLIKYNPIGVLYAPINKIKIMLWISKVCKMYNLE